MKLINPASLRLQTTHNGRSFGETGVTTGRKIQKVSCEYENVESLIIIQPLLEMWFPEGSIRRGNGNIYEYKIGINWNYPLNSFGWLGVCSVPLSNTNLISPITHYVISAIFYDGLRLRLRQACHICKLLHRLLAPWNKIDKVEVEFLFDETSKL